MAKFVQLTETRSSNDVLNLRKICGKVELSTQNLKSLKVEKSS